MHGAQIANNHRSEQSPGTLSLSRRGELRPVFIGDYKQKLSIEGFGSLSSESVSS